EVEHQRSWKTVAPRLGGSRHRAPAPSAVVRRSRLWAGEGRSACVSAHTTQSRVAAPPPLTTDHSVTIPVSVSPRFGLASVKPDSVRMRPSGVERWRSVTRDASPIGCTGVLTVGTRGRAGAGEVRIRIRGGSETYIAWSEEPLPKGAAVLV